MATGGVRIAFWLFMATAVAPVVGAVFGALLSLFAWFAFRVLRGANWARVTLVAVPLLFTARSKGYFR